MCGNMKFILSVDQRISQVSKANECSTREIISYSHASMYCSVYFIKQ